MRPLNYLYWLESCVCAADSWPCRNPGTVLSARTGRGRKRDVVPIPDVGMLSYPFGRGGAWESAHVGTVRVGWPGFPLFFLLGGPLFFLLFL
jgi:hypothetical protein